MQEGHFLTSPGRIDFRGAGILKLVATVPRNLRRFHCDSLTFYPRALKCLISLVGSDRGAVGTDSMGPDPTQPRPGREHAGRPYSACRHSDSHARHIQQNPGRALEWACNRLGDSHPYGAKRTPRASFHQLFVHAPVRFLQRFYKVPASGRILLESLPSLIGFCSEVALRSDNS